MPRLDPRLLRLVQRQDPLLAELLPVCRSLESARNEFRWLKQSIKPGHGHDIHHDHSSRLHQLVQRRARGEPLQYILGSEYFGDLEIKCQPGVLIPRQETAASVCHLVHRLLQAVDKLPRRLRVLDLCTGTGCIPLLFHHEFYRARESQSMQLDLTGVDLSSAAVTLATENHQAYLDQQLTQAESFPNRIHSAQGISFVQADILTRNKQSISEPHSLDTVLQQLPPEERTFDILVSNPPYISIRQYRTVTARSVRMFEPRSALVPQTETDADVFDGDQFYPRLWDIADAVHAKVVLFEVGDHAQALRVARMGGARSAWQDIEIWRDEPHVGGRLEDSSREADGFNVIGNGNSRSIFAARGAGTLWTSTQ